MQHIAGNFGEIKFREPAIRMHAYALVTHIASYSSYNIAASRNNIRIIINACMHSIIYDVTNLANFVSCML